MGSRPSNLSSNQTDSSKLSNLTPSKLSNSKHKKASNKHGSLISNSVCPVSVQSSTADAQKSHRKSNLLPPLNRQTISSHDPNSLQSSKCKSHTNSLNTNSPVKSRSRTNSSSQGTLFPKLTVAQKSRVALSSTQPICLRHSNPNTLPDLHLPKARVSRLQANIGAHGDTHATDDVLLTPKYSPFAQRNAISSKSLRRTTMQDQAAVNELTNKTSETPNNFDRNCSRLSNSYCRQHLKLTPLASPTPSIVNKESPKSYRSSLFSQRKSQLSEDSRESNSSLTVYQRLYSGTPPSKPRNCTSSLSDSRPKTPVLLHHSVPELKRLDSLLSKFDDVFTVLPDRFRHSMDSLLNFDLFAEQNGLAVTVAKPVNWKKQLSLLEQNERTVGALLPRLHQHLLAAQNMSNALHRAEERMQTYSRLLYQVSAWREVLSTSPQRLKQLSVPTTTAEQTTTNCHKTPTIAGVNRAISQKTTNTTDGLSCRSVPMITGNNSHRKSVCTPRVSACQSPSNTARNELTSL